MYLRTSVSFLFNLVCFAFATTFVNSTLLLSGADLLLRVWRRGQRHVALGTPPDPLHRVRHRDCVVLQTLYCRCPDTPCYTPKLSRKRRISLWRYSQPTTAEETCPGLPWETLQCVVSYRINVTVVPVSYICRVLHGSTPAQLA